MPVVHLSQLVGLACGIDPGDLQLNQLMVSPQQALAEVLAGLASSCSGLTGQVVGVGDGLARATPGSTCCTARPTLSYVPELHVYLLQRARGGRPRHIVLDIDSTDDPTHGQQEGAAYHGYYGQHMYHPLLVFDGETGQLITALLRPGTVHASRGVIGVLRAILREMRVRWPAVTIEIRADGGCAVPALYTFCERERIGYTIGLIPNPRLEAIAAPLLAHAQQRRAHTGDKTRLCAETRYQAGTWDQDRRVVYKAEALDKGPNTRFVVTSRDDAPTVLYDWYVDRGEAENWIKDLKRACIADRLSDHRFWANQFRLMLHAAAYWLLDTLRRRLCAHGHPRIQLDTLRLRLLKVGARVRELATCVRLHLASSHPSQPLWALLAMPRE